jgi:hypothetical protein
VRLEARKGAPLMGGAHTTTQSIFQRFGCEGGANPPMGREEKRGWASEGMCEGYKVGWVG